MDAHQSFHYSVDNFNPANTAHLVEMLSVTLPSLRTQRAALIEAIKFKRDIGDDVQELLDGLRQCSELIDAAERKIGVL